jgi:RNA polymerase sigma factor (sigma-70 family)
MPELDDHELLAEFARNESETAFAALVTRHVNLVYSAALRFTGNPHHAEEITQAVFLILARKAGTLSPRRVLSGWLYQTARLTAANFVKGEIRRQRREQEAYMQSTEPDPAVWEHIAPLLDEAMGRLGETDRNAIVLRFFENKTAREVGAALKLNEAAAHKRVNRALEKLRKIFTKRGVTLTVTALAGAVTANSVQAAPAGLAATILATAAKGAAVSASITTLVKGTLKLMTYAKLKLALGITAGILLAGGATTVVISQTAGSGDDKLTAQEIARQSQDAYAALTSYSDSGTAVTEGGGQTNSTTFNIRLQRPNLYRMDWTQTGGSYTSKGVIWSEGNGDFFVMGAAGQEKNFQPQREHDMQQAFASATGVSSQATSIPATFYKQPFGDALGLPASGRTQLQKLGDEKIGDVACYVFSSVMDPNRLPGQGKLPNNGGQIGTVTTTYWIGKRDHLIHQTRTSMVGATINLPRQSDDNLKTILERQNMPATPEAIVALRTQQETMMKQAQIAMKSSGFVFIQTHENIVVNQKFSPADFAQ